jgi:hypothetical protein
LHGGGPTEGVEEGGTYEPPAYQIPDDEDDDEEEAAAAAIDVAAVDVTDAAAAEAEGTDAADAEVDEAATEGAPAGDDTAGIASAIDADEEPDAAKTADPASSEEKTPG